MVELEQQYRDMRTEQQLQACGLTVDSIQSIKDTTVITRDGEQHVVPKSQSHLANASASQTVTMSNDDSAGHLASIQRQLQEQQRMFSRFKQYNDERTMKLEHHLGSALEQLKDVQQQLMTIKSNQQAQTRIAENSRASVYNTEQATANTTAPATAPSQATREAAKPIDRNNVAPVDVKVEKVFYCGES